MKLCCTSVIRWVLGAALFCWVLIAQAVVGNWQTEGPVSVRLVSPLSSLEGEGVLPLGLHIRLEDGWKTYWRTPGFAGAPPGLLLSHSALAEPKWHWPAPDRFEQFDQQLFGYKHEVLIPIDYVLKDNQQPLDLAGVVSVFVCREVCIPVKLSVSLHLPVNSSEDSEEAWSVSRLYNQFRSRVPASASLPDAEARWTSGGVYAEFSLDSAGDHPDIFPEGLDIEEWPAPQVEVRDLVVRVWWPLISPSHQAELPAEIQLTYRDSLQAFTFSVPLKSGSWPQPPNAGLKDLLPAGEQNQHWVWMILLALSGGLILNLMPCVLPVISIKLVAWSHLKHAARGVIRMHALMTTLGILSLFWLLATLLILLRTMGYYVGWGIQFQSPLFLLFLAILLSVFAANFLGWFEFRLPEKWQDSLNEVGNHSSALLKSYLHGMTATLLATPCSAPFLGTAVAFALTQDGSGILVIFTALGVGLAAPYLLIIALPGTVKWVPKGGRWSLILKGLLAGALGLTVVWLLWVLAASVSGTALMIVVILLGLSLLLLRRVQPANLLGVVGLWMAAVLIVQASSQWIPQNAVHPEATHGREQSEWQTFSRAQWEALREAQQTVLLDITADWCITCQYNKKVVLETEPMLRYFRESRVILMQADWTHPNPEIEALLTEYGRAGIPFNLLTGPKKPEGILLPELLTESIVREAVEQIK